MQIREYRGPLSILAAGAVGISLLCTVSAMAMTDLSNYVPATLVPLNIVDLAVANLNTAVGLTEQSITQFVPTPTATLTSTATASFTPSPTDTPRLFITVTPRRTRPPRDDTLSPTQSIRTNTPRPAPTNTAVPPTSTPLPPTRTPVPPTVTDLPTTAVPPTPVPPTLTPEPPTQSVPPTPIQPTDIQTTNPPVQMPVSEGSAPP